MRFSNREAFVSFMTADQPARPANIANIVAINQGRKPLTMGDPVVPGLDPAAVQALVADGAVIVDTRSTAARVEGHVPGSYHAHLTNAEFEQRVGWITPPTAPLVLVVERSELATAAARALAFLGLDARVKGYLAGGVEAWAAAGFPVDRLQQLAPVDVQARMASGLRVIDVREPREWDAGHIDGSINVSYRQLAARLGDLPSSREAPLAVVCNGGSTSATSVSILRRLGFQNVSNLAGGMKAWSDAGLPIVDGAGVTCAR